MAAVCEPRGRFTETLSSDQVKATLINAMIAHCLIRYHLKHAGVPASASGSANGASEEVEGYQLPPAEIQEIIEAPLQPLLSFSPDRRQVHSNVALPFSLSA